MVLSLEIPLDRRRLWSRLRINGSKVRRTLDWWRMIDDWSASARALIQARGAFRIFDVVRIGHEEVELEGGIRIVDLRRARLWQSAEKVALCAVTLGGSLEERCNALAVAGDYSEASLLSLIGDCALAEAQTKVIEEARDSLGHEPLKTGVVLQPGAQYWSLRGNASFSDVLPLPELGIQVLESFALFPSKSKTFACEFREGSRTAAGQENQ